MPSIIPKVAAIASICGLLSFGSAHAAECVGSGHRSTFGVNAAVYFEVKSGGSCHYAFKMEGAVKNSKISAAPKNGTVRLLNNTSFEYKPKAGYKGPDSFAIETTGSNQTGSGTSVLTMSVVVN